MFGVAAVVLAALGLSPLSGGRPEAPTAVVVGTSTAVVVGTSTAVVVATPSAQAAQPAQDLFFTSAVRASLVEAGASHYGLPASDFVGLASGPGYYDPYYAYDRTTSTYWAAASLVPNPGSVQAGVVVQDDGAYLIFERAKNGPWAAHDVGYTDTVGTCAAYHVSIPAAVVAVWHWVPGTCHPAVTPASTPLTTTPPPTAPPTTEPTAAPSGTEASNVPVTKALGAEILASYYHAYVLDPTPSDVFGVPTGEPESHVREPFVEDAGVIYASSPGAYSFWVVASICFDIPTGCEDEGAFQVFHREGESGYFAYLTGPTSSLDVCDIPQPLAGMWFPGGRYPMGGTCPSARPVSDQPVLGSAAFIPRIGVGWGTYKPPEIFNGGDPSGKVYAITWTGWGKPVAYGYGKTYIFKPGGGYYPAAVPAQLRAFDLGHCTVGGPLAYRLLEVRGPSKPGGQFGTWFIWDDVKTLCTPYP
jgi:hypothetical protein